jgi:hypothetical protein
MSENGDPLRGESQTIHICYCIKVYLSFGCNLIIVFLKPTKYLVLNLRIKKFALIIKK